MVVLCSVLVYILDLSTKLILIVKEILIFKLHSILVATYLCTYLSNQTTSDIRQHLWHCQPFMYWTVHSVVIRLEWLLLMSVCRFADVV